MFLLETEYFVWNVIAWTVNFLLVAITIFLAMFVAKKVGKSFPVESKGCPISESDLFQLDLEKFLWNLREDVFEVWLVRPWMRIAAPLFLLLLFMVAVHAA